MLTIRDSQMQNMAQAAPGTQMIQPCDKTATWIEVRLTDEDGNPCVGASYRIQLPDSSIMLGALDDEGKVRFEQIVPGQAEIAFPEIDGREWKPK
jgi:hypothetical protein